MARWMSSLRRPPRAFGNDRERRATMRNTVALAVCCLLTGGLLVLHPGSTAAHPYGEEGVVPLDFITGGFWFIIQAPSSGHPPVGSIPGTRANGGWHGGVKNFDWWGNG